MCVASPVRTAKGTAVLNDVEMEITLALIEAKERFPDVISLQFDPVTRAVSPSPAVHRRDGQAISQAGAVRRQD